MRRLYAIEVRSAEDCSLLGHVHSPTPPYRLPPYFTFALRGSVDDKIIQNVTLKVEQYFEGGCGWHAFSVPAAQWEEIKDKIV